MQQINKNKSQSTIKTIYSLWKYLNHKRKIQLIILSLVMVINAGVEILSLASVMPFLSIITEVYSENNALMKLNYRLVLLNMCILLGLILL